MRVLGDDRAITSGSEGTRKFSLPLPPPLPFPRTVPVNNNPRGGAVRSVDFS